MGGKEDEEGERTRNGGGRGRGGGEERGEAEGGGGDEGGQEDKEDGASLAIATFLRTCQKLCIGKGYARHTNSD